MRKSTGIAAALAAAGLVAAGVAAPASAKGPKAPGDVTLYDFVSSSDDFEYLTAALEATGLDAALDMEGVQYTVFAPTDDAFEKAADELGFVDVGSLLGYLVANDLADDVLLYHVTDGRRWSNSVVPKKGEKSIEPLAGPSFEVTSMGYVVDEAPSTSDAKIIDANVNASNGVAHAIDNVLVPLGI
jgi:uncharacterized surface protein with fasciclin (FAS1) repeats